MKHMLTAWDEAIDYFEFPAGDFDHDFQLTANDIDVLTQSIRDGISDSVYDLDENGTVDLSDRQYWVVDLASSHFGDANLDGSVDFEDFLALSSHFGSDGG